MLRSLIAAVILTSSVLFVQAQKKEPRKVAIISTKIDKVINLKLKNYKIALDNDPLSQGYIVIEGNVDEVTSVVKIIRKHLSILKFDMSRITIEIVDIQEVKTWQARLYIIPPGKSPSDIENE